MTSDFGGVRFGALGATAPTEVEIAGNIRLALAAGANVELAGGAPGAFVQLTYGGAISNEPVVPAVPPAIAVLATVRLNNGGSYARITKHPAVGDTLSFAALNCTNCIQLSSFEITGTDRNGFVDGLLGQVGTGGLPGGGGGGGFKIDAKDKEDDIAVDAGETCK